MNFAGLKILVFAIGLSSLGGGCMSSGGDGRLGLGEDVSAERLNAVGYLIDEKQGDIEFIFDSSVQQDPSLNGVVIQSVSVAGTFTQWKPGTEGFVLSRAGGRWLLRVLSDMVRAPGSSGFPEFKFVVNGNLWVQPMGAIPDGLAYSDSQSGRNLVLVRNSHQREQVLTQFDRLRKNFERFTQQTRLSEIDINWRAVQGKMKKGLLYRSSAPWAFADEPRSPGVRDAMMRENVRAIIGLAGDHSAEMHKFAKKDKALSHFADPKAALFLASSYNEVYYRSGSVDLAEKVISVLEFMHNSPGPFVIYCQEGKDRTGVFVAILRALVGESWDVIVDDYERSGEAGFSSLPHKNLLEYSFDEMMGAGRENLQERMEGFLRKQSGVDEIRMKALIGSLVD